MFSRKTTRAAAGEYSRSDRAGITLNLSHRSPAAAGSAAGPSTNPPPTPSTSSSAPSAMRMRSGRLLAPLVEGAKTVRSKLTGARRGAKAPSEVPPPAEASTSAQADATSSNVANPAPTPRKAAPKKRPTTARGRATKRKAPEANPAPVPQPEADPTPAASAPLAIAAPVPAAIAAPSRATTAAPEPSSPSHSDALAPAAVPEHSRLQRQDAYYLDRHGWALPKGVSLDKDGNPPLSALLEVVEKEVSLEALMAPPPIAAYAVSAYDTDMFRQREHVVQRSIISSARTWPQEWLVHGAWNPVTFPSVPAQPQQNPNAPPAPTNGTRITRQYAEIFGEDGFPLPYDDDGTDEPVPIGEIVANLLKAGRVGPYPKIWRGSLFETEEEASQTASVAAPASFSVSAAPAAPIAAVSAASAPATSVAAVSAASAPATTVSAGSDPVSAPAVSAPAAPVPAAAGNSAEDARPRIPLPPPGRRLQRQRSVLIPVDENGIVTSGPVLSILAPPAPVRISRQNAVYFDRNGVALPEGETITAAAQFPESAPQTPHHAGPSRGTDPTPRLSSIFAPRSRQPMVAQPFVTAAGQPALNFVPAEEAEAPAPSAAEGRVSAQEVEDHLEDELRELEEEQEEHEVFEVLSANAKGKKRARSPVDREIEVSDAYRREWGSCVKRVCTVDVRSHTTVCSDLLSVKVSVVPIPGGLCDGDDVLIFSEGKGPFDARENKRSRDEFEEDEDAFEEDPDARAAKKARVEPEIIEIL
ncbi:hypothetical protein TRAPUB_12662 [Trametes pubescens]|uniref:Uncharacterized protein n=1 Tax=Trametes pubescens TaxID=154538 RepID=A0A1M2VT62_TRAPU|nr:hypothetical protein TRAPUB_12662 [Trametes pubescens]